MKKVALVLIMLSSFICCKPKKSDNTISDLQNCFSKNDIEELTNALNLFESELAKIYPNESKNQAYLKYINDVGLMKIPIDFFLKKELKLVLDKLNQVGTFEKIWTSLSSINLSDNSDEQFVEISLEGEVISSSKEEEKEALDLICLNPKGVYMNCLLGKKIDNSIVELLRMQKIAPGVNAQATSYMLLETMNESDFDNELNCLIISIQYYYEMVYAFQNNKR